MPKSFPRSRRVAEQIQRNLSELVRREVRDPRLGPLTLTEVRMSSDLSYATVYYSVLGGSKDPALTQSILEEAADFLRGPLGRSLGLRHSPEIRFVADELLEQGAQLDALIRKAVNEDKAKHVDESDASTEDQQDDTPR